MFSREVPRVNFCRTRTCFRCAYKTDQGLIWVTALFIILILCVSCLHVCAVSVKARRRCQISELELQSCHTCAKNRKWQPWVWTVGTKSIPGGYSWSTLLIYSQFNRHLGHQLVPMLDSEILTLNKVLIHLWDKSMPGSSLLPLPALFPCLLSRTAAHTGSTCFFGNIGFHRLGPRVLIILLKWQQKVSC